MQCGTKIHFNFTPIGKEVNAPFPPAPGLTLQVIKAPDVESRELRWVFPAADQAVPAQKPGVKIRLVYIDNFPHSGIISLKITPVLISIDPEDWSMDRRK